MNKLEIGDKIYVMKGGNYLTDELVVDRVTERTALAGGIRFRRFYTHMIEPVQSPKTRPLEIIKYKPYSEKLEQAYLRLIEARNKG